MMTTSPYRVLARKYRPGKLTELIGQDVMVRILTNALVTGRIAHAFMLTGVRGVGKTTTARIIARGLNCLGQDGNSGPTINPCGICSQCDLALNERHLDIIEMDAASHTGVADIRDLIEGVLYAPVSGRYKIYIIDEVHMLSNNAFNALLKTLEEPPPHVKFIFATTEIRKVPVTILSRCQRFDLKRVDEIVLQKYFGDIAKLEGFSIDPEAVGLIARAAEGSVRDGLSLLDQALILSENSTIKADAVRHMLGSTDQKELLELYEHLVTGLTSHALEKLKSLYVLGSDPILIIKDLLELTAELSRLQISPDLYKKLFFGETNQILVQKLSTQLSVSILAKLWQLLLKGLAEIQTAPNPYQAAEMLIIRLTHTASLPTPAELIDLWQNSKDSKLISSPSPVPSSSAAIVSNNKNFIKNIPTSELSTPEIVDFTSFHLPQNPIPSSSLTSDKISSSSLTTFEDMVDLFAQKREAILHTNLVYNTRLVRYQKGNIEINVTDQTPKNFINRLATCLNEWTNERWTINLTQESGGPTLAEKKAMEEERKINEAMQHPIAKTILENFPNAKVDKIIPLNQNSDAVIDTYTKGDTP
ncbi:MAG: DNA polymerase III subunit gamma/tau [Alphaproteobacteria bacterium]|nr:DNA polymerase III subunit gamma/tau [Alphaproteobacteria bacterium]